MKMTSIMTVVAAMAAPVFAADSAAELSMTTPATDTATVVAPAATMTPPAGAKDCGMLGWLHVDTITAEAANGDPVAQFTVAYLTDNGLGDMPQDTAKADELYTAALPGLMKAADEGNAHACRALAHMYEHGKGVDKDHDKAAHYKALCEKCCKDKDGKCCKGVKPADCDKTAPKETPADTPSDSPASNES